MTARAKAPAVPVPQTRQEFETLAVELGETMRAIDATNAAAADAIARTKLQAKDSTAPLARNADAMFKAVAGYAEAHRAELLTEGRKSIAIAAGLIGWRLSKPAVKVEDEEGAIAQIEALQLDNSFLRVTTELDRQALLAAPDAAAAIAGITIVQREELFFKPLDLDEEKVRKAPAGSAA